MFGSWHYVLDRHLAQNLSRLNIMADSYQQLRVQTLHASLSVMGSHLRDVCHATEDELAYLNEILDSQAKKQNSLLVGRGLYSSPSVVLDGFLYHGDFGHASNMKLLTKLGIHRIVNVCDGPLDRAIREGFQVLWINVNDEFQTDIKRHFDETNAFLKQCQENNEKVLVHCQMGISRSSAIVLAYLMK